MGTEGMSAGPGLMFVALPKVFDSLGIFGPILGILFFMMVLFAAITSAVSILEACVTSVIDRFHWSRRKSVCILSLIGAGLSFLVCRGYNDLFFEYTLPNGANAQLLDIFDYVSNNVLMPFLSICTCLLIGWVVTPKLLVGEMRLNGYSFHRKTLYVIMLKFVVPIIMAILLLGAFGLY